MSTAGGARGADAGVRAHVLHLSSADALPMSRSARRERVRLTVETCPHYLTLVAEEIPAGATAYTCCPPIREAANRELLWVSASSVSIRSRNESGSAAATDGIVT